MDMQAGCECDGYENTEWKEMLGCVDEKYRVIITPTAVDKFGLLFPVVNGSNICS